MWHFIRSAGPFAAPLAILTVLLGVAVVRTALHRRRSGETSGAGLLQGGAAILFWGFVAAILGFLGQCAALYRIMRIVVPATAISPDVLAEGFGASFVPTLWGSGLLLVAGVAWLLLRATKGTRSTLAV